MACGIIAVSTTSKGKVPTPSGKPTTGNLAVAAPGMPRSGPSIKGVRMGCFGGASNKRGWCANHGSRQASSRGAPPMDRGGIYVRDYYVAEPALKGTC